MRMYGLSNSQVTLSWLLTKRAIGRAVQQECRDRYRMPSSAWKKIAQLVGRTAGDQMDGLGGGTAATGRRARRGSRRAHNCARFVAAGAATKSVFFFFF